MLIDGRPRVSGTVAAPEGITSPPIDELLTKVDSTYSLVLYSAALNSYQEVTTTAAGGTHLDRR